MFLAYFITALISVFQGYPSIADVVLYLSLLLIHAPLFPYMRHTFLVVNALCYASILGPLFFDLWIYAGSGNANFFYAITLVFGLAQVRVRAVVCALVCVHLMCPVRVRVLRSSSRMSLPPPHHPDARRSSSCWTACLPGSSGTGTGARRDGAPWAWSWGSERVPPPCLCAAVLRYGNVSSPCHVVL